MAGGGGNKKRYHYCNDSVWNNLVLPSSSRTFRAQFLLILHYRTMLLIPDDFFKYIYHVGCATNVTFHHQFGTDTWRSTFEQADRQCSFCLWIPWTKTIRIFTRSTWKHRVMHNTCIKRGRNNRTQCIGST